MRTADVATGTGHRWPPLLAIALAVGMAACSRSGGEQLRPPDTMTPTSATTTTIPAAPLVKVTTPTSPAPSSRPLATTPVSRPPEQTTTTTSAEFRVPEENLRPGPPPSTTTWTSPPQTIDPSKAIPAKNG
jgi:hypothetical protein